MTHLERAVVDEVEDLGGGAERVGLVGPLLVRRLEDAAAGGGRHRLRHNPLQHDEALQSRAMGQGMGVRAWAAQSRLRVTQRFTRRAHVVVELQLLGLCQLQALER